MGGSAAAGSAGLPSFPGVSSILVDLDRAGEVGVRVAGRTSSTTGVPVDGIDLPESHIGRSILIESGGMRVPCRFMGNNALAATLVPGVLGAPCADVYHVLASPAEAILAVAGWAVAPA